MSHPQEIAVLFSSAGRRVELVNCFRKDAAELGRRLRAIAVDLNPAMSSACHAADKRYPVPRCTDDAFIGRLLEICAAEQVNLVVPTIDTELENLALNQDRFRQIGTRVAISSSEVVRLARSKLETTRTLRKHKIPTPQTVTLEDLLSAPASWRWPLILKPIAGSSSIGVHIVGSPEALRHLRIDPAMYVAQELSKGTEYTVNVYFDSTGEVRCAVPHARIETRGGEVSKGRTERHPVLMALAEQVGAALRGQAYGALCFQGILTPEGEAMVFEINARFGGGFPLAHRAGAPFSKWLLEDALGLPCSAHNHWQEDLVMLRYDTAIFLERERAR